MFLWIASLEDGAIFDNEHFLPTYGQLLAIFVAVPPFLQLLNMYGQLWRWFIDLTWVRFLTCRLHVRRSSEGSGGQPSEDSAKQLPESPTQQSPDTYVAPRMPYDQRPQGMHQQQNSYDSGRTLQTISENEKSEKTTQSPSAMNMV